MATKLLDDVTLPVGIYTTDPITSVGNLSFTIDLTEVPPKEGIFVTLKAKEGDGGYDRIYEPDDKEVFWIISDGKKVLRKGVIGVNTESLVFEFSTPTGYSGNITLNYTKTDNPNT